MRNPDKWTPPDPDDAPGASRRAALIGLVVIVLLVAGALLVSHVLHSEARFQDCTISGRVNCADGQ